VQGVPWVVNGASTITLRRGRVGFKIVLGRDLALTDDVLTVAPRVEIYPQVVLASRLDRVR
jgi:hypothetical protein